MINALGYLGIFVGGMVLGLVFFGGLWLTIRKALGSKTPALWFALSMFVRVGITLAGFYLLTRGHLVNFVFCLPGFMVAKILFIYLSKHSARSNNHNTKEKNNAAQSG